MPVIASRIERESESFRTNRAAMLKLVAEFRALEEQVRRTSNAKKDQFAKRGQLLPRERVALLLDRGSPFLEISTLAGLGMHDDDGKENVLGGGVIDGIGYVSGVRCLISASDSAHQGRHAPRRWGSSKKLRCQEIALREQGAAHPARRSRRRQPRLPGARSSSRAGRPSATRRGCRPRACRR